MSTLDLKINSVIGFSGKVAGALNYSPCGQYVIYPLGSFCVVKHIKTQKEAFLDGHSRPVSCIKVSNDGAYIASGQSNFVGVKVRHDMFTESNLLYSTYCIYIWLC